MSFTNQSSLPQGFSVYQPALGAQLIFCPALGTKQLDEFVNAYVPGPMSIQEKRATITLDFLSHLDTTGQAFKFYAVQGYVNSPEASLSASPAQGSVSSVNVSPITSNWDWSYVSAAPSSSSQSSTSRKPSAASTPRHQATDFSHIPGMKIMTKDGLDVTNSASRGSKSKEQRDHAHLMRVLKACDSCKKKKTRCDPSHKRRVASQAQAPAGVVKSAKKARTSPTAMSAMATPVVEVQKGMPAPAPSIGMDQSFSLYDLESFTADYAFAESFETFEQTELANFEPDYDFFLDPEGYLSSPQSSSSSSPTSESLARSITSLQDPLVEPEVRRPRANATPSSLLEATSEMSTGLGEFAENIQETCLPPYVGHSGIEGLQASYYDSSQYYDPSLLEGESMLNSGGVYANAYAQPSGSSLLSSWSEPTSAALQSPIESLAEYSDYAVPTCPPSYAPCEDTEANALEASVTSDKGLVISALTEDSRIQTAILEAGTLHQDVPLEASTLHQDVALEATKEQSLPGVGQTDAVSYYDTSSGGIEQDQELLQTSGTQLETSAQPSTLAPLSSVAAAMGTIAAFAMMYSTLSQTAYTMLAGGVPQQAQEQTGSLEGQTECRTSSSNRWSPRAASPMVSFLDGTSSRSLVC